MRIRTLIIYSFLGLWLLGCGRNTSEPVVTAIFAPVSSTSTPEPPKPTGTLIILDNSDYPDHRIVRFDVATGKIETLFSAPEFSWIYQFDVSQGTEQVIFSYSPPPGEGRGLFDRSGIYALPLSESASETTVLLGSNLPNEFYYEPSLSPDGRFMYSVRYQVDPASPIGAYRVLLERYDLALRENLPITADGIWPRVSPDGTKLVFIGVDPRTLRRGLYLSELDGSQIQELVPLGKFFDIDTPIFSSDGSAIYLSVAENPPEGSFFDWLLGVRTAYAHADHNVPSDWWRVSLTDGTLEKVTDTQMIILSGDFSSDGQFLAFSTTTGLFVMQADGTNITQLKSGETFGTVHWLE